MSTIIGELSIFFEILDYASLDVPESRPSAEKNALQTAERQRGILRTAATGRNMKRAATGGRPYMSVSRSCLLQPLGTNR
jgi:hypothetical protein